MPEPPDKSAVSTAPHAGVGAPHRTPAASVLLFRGDDLLLVQRAEGGFAGLWSAPGGHRVDGECAIETARRELREETGLVVEQLHPLTTHTVHLDAAPGAPARIYEIAVFVGIAPRGAVPSAADDAAAARFFSPPALQDLQLTPGLAKLITTARTALPRLAGR